MAYYLLRNAGITEERARMHLAKGHVYADGVRVSDPPPGPDPVAVWREGCRALARRAILGSNAESKGWIG